MRWRYSYLVTCHNWLCDVFIDLCHRAHLGIQVEVGSGFTADLRQTCPAVWERGKPAPCDLPVTSHLLFWLTDSGLMAGAAAKKCKHASKDPKCEELSSVCVPLVVETYDRWCKKAHNIYNILSHLTIGHCFIGIKVCSHYRVIWKAQLYPHPGCGKSHLGKSSTNLTIINLLGVLN